MGLSVELFMNKSGTKWDTDFTDKRGYFSCFLFLSVKICADPCTSSCLVYWGTTLIPIPVNDPLVSYFEDDFGGYLSENHFETTDTLVKSMHKTDLFAVSGLF